MVDETVLHVRVTARAGRDALGEMVDGVLAVRLAAPPVEGAANSALIAFLADAFGIPKSNIRIEAGRQSRRKRVRICGLAPADLAGRLAQRGD